MGQIEDLRWVSKHHFTAHDMSVNDEELALVLCRDLLSKHLLH